MSTETLGRSLKIQYPDTYDDLSDHELGAKYETKFPTGRRELPRTEPTPSRYFLYALSICFFAVFVYFLYNVNGLPDFVICVLSFYAGVKFLMAGNNADQTEALNSGQRAVTLANEIIAHAHVIARRGLEAARLRSAVTDELRRQYEEEYLRLQTELFALAREKGLTVEALIELAVATHREHLKLQSEGISRRQVLDAGDYVDYYKTVRALESQYEDTIESLAQAHRDKGPKNIKKLKIDSLTKRMARIEADLMRVGVDIDVWKRNRFLPS